MGSIRCPKCKTVTLAERGKCPRCNYDFSKLVIRTEPVTFNQAAKETVAYVGEQVTVFLGTLAWVFERIGVAVRNTVVFVAAFVGKAIEVALNVLVTPIFYAGEKIAVGARYAFYLSVRIFVATLVGAAELRTGVQSLPERFKRRPKQLAQKEKRPIEVRPVTAMPLRDVKGPSPSVAVPRPLMRTGAVEAAPPFVRRVPAEVAREAVDVVPAGILPRFLAGAVDILIISVAVALMLVPAWLSGSFNFLSISPDRFAKVSLTIYLFALAVAGIYLVVAMSVYGKTFGKQLFGLRVIRVSGEPLGLYDSFVRFSAWLISGLFFGLGWLWLVFDINHRSLHDYLSQTVVIRDVS